jgi:hypothetical protein
MKMIIMISNYIEYKNVSRTLWKSSIPASNVAWYFTWLFNIKLYNQIIILYGQSFDALYN